MSQVELIFAKNLDLYMVQHPNCILLDVRPQEEYEKSHIKNAVSIPYEEDMEWDLDKSKRIVVYCERGSASIQAARSLVEKGYKAASVVGGIREYRGRNLVFLQQS